MSSSLIKELKEIQLLKESGAIKNAKIFDSDLYGASIGFGLKNDKMIFLRSQRGKDIKQFKSLETAKNIIKYLNFNEFTVEFNG